MQHGMCESYVAVGLSFGSPDSPEAAVYAYIAPQPDGLEGRAWGAESARWVPEAGLIVLPWEGLRCSEDPGQTVLDFADAVYLAAVETAGWPPDLVGERLSGWDASRTQCPAERPWWCKRRRVRCACCHLGYDVDSAPASTDTWPARFPSGMHLMATGA